MKSIGLFFKQLWLIAIFPPLELGIEPMLRKILGMTSKLWPTDLPLPMYADGDLVPAPSWDDCDEQTRDRLGAALRVARIKLAEDDMKRETVH